MTTRCGITEVAKSGSTPGNDTDSEGVRVSSREDSGRYRGRRRAPTPPRSRYAAVATTALVGAGVVALATSHLVPDHSGDLTALSAANLSAGSSNIDLAARQANADRANRDAARTDPQSLAALAPNLWELPLHSYTMSPTSSHVGVDLVVPEGTTYYAAHGGTVALARWYGGYGYTVMIDAGNGTTLVYAHSAMLLVQEGQHVNAGDALGLTGATGYARNPCLYFEIQQGGATVDASAYLLAHGVDLVHQSQAIDS
jgi:murein DD-endopeptidase MepM/ murein hydrolase activator NlpD